MVKTLKAAVIGCGRIGAFTREGLKNVIPKHFFPINHCATLNAIPYVKLVAVCDINKKAAQEAAKMHNAEYTYTDYKKMILEQKLDLVTVATRTQERPEIISFAAKRGVRGIYAEKPFSRNLKDAKTALKAVEKNKVAIAYGTFRRYLQTQVKAKKMIQSGTLGALEQIIINFGKTTLMWNHPHSIDLIVYFAEDTAVDYVQSALNFKKNSVKNDVIDDDPVLEFGFVKFRNGVSGIITSSENLTVHLICKKGEIKTAPDGSFITIHKKTHSPYFPDVERIKIENLGSGTQNAIAELCRSIRSRKQIGITTREILLEQQILLGLAYSGIHHGKRVKPSEIDDNLTVTGRTDNLYA